MRKAIMNKKAFTPTPIYVAGEKLEKTLKTALAGFQDAQPKCKLVRGFTLIEALMALVILSIAAAGLILPFASSMTVQQQGCSQTLAAKLASDLIEQIINTDFSQIVTTYNGYNETKGQIKNAAGVVFSDPMYADLSRQAVCEYIYMPQQASVGTPNFIRITVRVYQNGVKLAEVVRLKSK
jgi:prepilin-type N-terminal cleavage/methylation domain-containing protein